ncbi:helix-turn-helix domain-containing protein [Kosakonia radicincitans]|uniref:helix-turn-helix domain-containing protein n=1 Tax=Kosakonia radicincitans TaxID=283686 RepID=UPI001FC9F755|nr:helix-turn-helix transcriptional regulator [Kosakonia radicincitans]
MLKVSFCHFIEKIMSGFELRLWRRGFNWDQERAAEELGISLRTYKRYENANEISKLVELATSALTLKYIKQ